MKKIYIYILLLVGKHELFDIFREKNTFQKFVDLIGFEGRIRLEVDKKVYPQNKCVWYICIIFAKLFFKQENNKIDLIWNIPLRLPILLYFTLTNYS